MTFKPPTIEEAKEFAKSIGFTTFKAGKWWHHYDANNWFRGKTKMSRWKSAVWTWFYDSDQYKAKERQPKPSPAPVVKKTYVPTTDAQKAEIRAKSKFFKAVEPVRNEQEKEAQRLKCVRDFEQYNRNH